MEEKQNKKTSKAQKQVIDETVLTNSIVNALQEYDNKKKEKETKEYYEEKQTKKVGFGMFFKMLFFPKKYLNTDGANEAVVKGFLKVIYKIFEYIFLISSILLIAYIPLQFIWRDIPVVSWWIDVIYGCAAVIGFIISRVLRIMALDVERSRDKNFLVALLAVIIALISMVIAIIK